MYEANAFLDNGEVEIEMSKAELRELTTAHLNALIQEMPAPDFKTQNANGYLVKVTKQVLFRFFSSTQI